MSAPGEAGRAGAYPGLRILELAGGGAGPLVTRAFAEQGATVVRVEPAPWPDGPPEDVEAALRDAGKRSVAIDLEHPEGAALVRRLADWAEVVVESLAPAALERLGLAPARLLEERPALLVLSIGRFGRSGEASGAAGPGREPIGLCAELTDPLAARYAAALLAAALFARDATGQGQHLDVSQVEVAVHALSEQVVRWAEAGEASAREDDAGERAAPGGVYPCDGDGAWIAITARDDGEWDALVAAMGDPVWAAEPRFAGPAERRAHAAELDERLAAWTRGFAPYDLMAGLQEAGVPAGIVQGPAALLRDPQLAHRGHFQRVAHPHFGPLFVERSGFRLALHPGGFASAGPLPGEDTEPVLREALGLAAEEIALLRARGALGRGSPR